MRAEISKVRKTKQGNHQHRTEVERSMSAHTGRSNPETDGMVLQPHADSNSTVHAPTECQGLPFPSQFSSVTGTAISEASCLDGFYFLRLCMFCLLLYSNK